MLLTNKAPGVYIDEIPATGPIAGVSTSTAAFLGPTVTGTGLLNQPTMVTNWTQFKTLYGEYSATPRLFLPHALRGFFDNGGTAAIIVSVATARWFREFNDRGTPTPGKSLRVEAKDTNGSDVSVSAADVQIVPLSAGAVVAKASAKITSASGTTITLQTATDSAKFQPGDTITIDAATTERAVIDSINGTTAGTLLLRTPLAGTYTNTSIVRLADLIPKQKTFRVQNNTGIEAGSYMRLTQGTTTFDYIVDGVSGDFVTVALPFTAPPTFLMKDADPAITAATLEFSLTVTKTGIVTTFSPLSMDPRHSKYYGKIVNTAPNSPVLLMPPAVPGNQNPPLNLPVGATGSLAAGLPDGTNIGLNAYKSGLDALTRVDGVNMVCVPDAAANTAVQQSVLAHCESMRDRFAVLDSAPTTSSAPDPATDAVKVQRGSLESAGSGGGPGFAALYFPWIQINDPLSQSGADPLLVPPSGHIAGVYARSDDARGVHKAPANEYLTGAVSLERILNDTDQGFLNEAGINVLRIFPGLSQPIIWGARTTAPLDQAAFRYINVRRLFLFVEKSIQAGIRWAVFEPNDLSLWKKLDRTITEFLTRVLALWRPVRQDRRRRLLRQDRRGTEPPGPARPGGGRR